MSAAKFARELLQLNGLPKTVIAELEEILVGYEVVSWSDFDDLLHDFLALYDMEGAKAVETFKSKLIK